MWLPDSIYARLPQFWLLMGLLFFAFGLYLGFDYELIFVYLGTGAFCVLRSLWTFKVRREFRKIPFTTINKVTTINKPIVADADADQSPESDAPAV